MVERGFNATNPDDQIRFYSEALRLKPNYAVAFYNRGLLRKAGSDPEGVFSDYNEAIRLKPGEANPYCGRALVLQKKDNLSAAIADFQQFLNLGGGVSDGFEEKAEEMIRDLKKKL